VCTQHYLPADRRRSGAEQTGHPYSRNSGDRLLGEIRASYPPYSYKEILLSQLPHVKRPKAIVEIEF